MLIHKLNMDALNKEAEKLAERGTNNGGNNWKWFKFQLGDNVIRVCPPYNQKGKYFLERIQHFQLYPENKIHPCMCSWYDNCYICDTIKKLYEMFPGVVDLDQQKSSSAYLVNLVDRSKMDVGVQVGSLSQGIHSWLIDQIRDEKIGDVTDPLMGFDIKITKLVKKGRTSYQKTLMPRPCKLHESKDIMEIWLNELPDLDLLDKEPTSDEIAEIKSTTSAMVQYYVNRFGNQQQSYSQKVSETANTREERFVRNNQDQKTDTKREERKTEVVVPSEENKKVINKYPICYMGNEKPEPHEDGSIGFSDKLEKCAFCAYEIDCLREKRNKRV